MPPPSTWSDQTKFFFRRHPSLVARLWAGRIRLHSPGFQLPGALFVVVAITIAGASPSMRIPRWVEVTSGEVLAIGYHRDSRSRRRWPEEARRTLGEHPDNRWAATSLPLVTAPSRHTQLFLYPAFVAKAHE